MSSVTNGAAAEPPVTSSLEWEAPSGKGCPSADELAQAVEARLGRRVFVPVAKADVRLRGAIAANGRVPWTVTLTLHDAREHELGTRELRSLSKSCSALRDTLPVVVALLIDLPRPRIELELPEPPVVPESTVPRARPTADSEPPNLAKPAEAAAARSWSFGGALMGAAAIGVVPRWGWGMAMAFDVRPPAGPYWSLWVSEIGPSASSSTETELGVLVSIRQAGLRVCPSLLGASAPVTVDACAGWSLGQVATRGVGYDENLAQSQVYSALEGGVRVGVPIFKTVAIGLDAMAEAPLSRARFYGEATPGDRSLVFRSEVVGARLHLGLVLRPE